MNELSAQPCNANANFNFSPLNGICPGEVVNFTPTAATSANYSFNWNFADPASGAQNTSTQQNPQHAFTAGGTYNVCLIVIRNNQPSCRDTFCRNVTVLNGPAAGLIDASGSITPFVNCASGSTQYTLQVVDNSTANGTTITNYFLNWGDGSPPYNGSVPPNNVTHTYNTLGFFTITYIISSTNGCSDTLRQTVFNGSNPAVGLGNPGNTNGCLPYTLSFPISGTASNPPGTTYTVTINDGSAPISYTHPPPANVVHTFNSNSCGITSSNGAQSFPNSFSVSITATNPCGVSAAAIVPIYISNPGQADFSFSPDPGCINQPVTFTNTSVNPVNVTGSGSCDSTDRQNWIITPAAGWSVSSGTLGNFTGTPAGSDVLGVTFTTSGIYNVTFISRGLCGNDTITKPICVTGPPTAAFTVNPNQGCVPLAVNTVNTTTVIQNCVPSTYAWNIGFTPVSCSQNNGNFTFTNGTSSASTNPSLLLQDAGVYALTLTASNVCGSASLLENINVGSPPVITVNSINNACGSLALSPGANFNNCNQPITSYSWLFPGGNPANSNQQNPGTVSYTNSTASAVTYTVTASATNGCGTGSDTARFTLLPVPSPVANANPTPVCSGLPVQLSVAQAAQYASINWSNGQSGSPVTVNPSASTSYTTTVTNSFGCTGSDTVNVVVNPLPTVAAGAPLTLCQNAGAVQLTTGTPAGGTWSGTGVSPGGLFNPSGLPAGTVTLTYSYTSPSSGCTNSANQSITVISPPVLTLTSPLSLCNSPGLINLNNAASPTPAGGSWFGPNVNGSANFNPVAAGNGQHFVFYTYTDGTSGCSDTLPLTINVAAPAIANAGTGFTVCIDGSPIQLNGLPAGGNWSGPGVNAGGLFTPSSAGAGLAVLTYSYGSGNCLSQDTLQINIIPLPTVSAGPALSFCIDAGIQQLNGSPNGGTWSGSGVNATGLFNPATAGTGPQVITYSFTNANGCTNTATTTLTVNPLPAVDAGNNLSFCDTNLVVAIGTNASPTGGSWSGSNVTTGGSLNLGPLATGVYSYFYTFTDPNGCDAVDSIQVTITSPVPANAGQDFSLCVDGTPVALSGIPAGGTWSGTGINGNSFDPASAGTGTWVLTYTYGTGSCQSSDQLSATVFPLPIVSAGPALSFCIDAGIQQLNGNPNGGTWSGTGVSVNGQFDPLLSGQGAYLLTYAYTDGNTCSNTDSVSIQVNPLPTVNAGPDTSYCFQPIPAQLPLTNPAGGVWSGPGVTNPATGAFNPAIAGTGVHPVVYTYTDANNCSNSDTLLVSVVNPANVSAGNDTAVCIFTSSFVLNGNPSGGSWSGTVISSNGTVTPNQTGLFGLIYTFGSGTCLRRDTLQLIIHALPVLNLSGNTTAICVDKPVFSLTAQPAGGIWSGNGVINGSQFNPGLAGSGTSTISYAYTDNNGCVNTDSIQIIVHPLPLVNAGNDTTVCDLPAPVILAGNFSNAGSWSGTGVSVSGVFVSPGIGSYNLVYSYTDNNGCNNSDTLLVTVVSPLVADAGPGDTVCVDIGTITLPSFFPATGGNWNGPGITNPATGTFDPALAFQNDTTTTAFTLFYSYGSGNCFTIDSTIVIVHPLPTVIAGSNIDTCISIPAFTLSGNSPSGGWWTGPGILDSVAGTVNPQIAGAGIHNLIYTYIQPGTGCRNADTLQFKVNPIPIPGFILDSVLCVNSSYTPTNTSIGASAWFWDFGNGITSTLQTPAIVYANPGIYSILQIVTSPEGCQDSIRFTVLVVVPPQPSFTVLPAQGCGPLEVNFTNTSISFEPAYSWNLGNGITDTSANPAPATYIASLYNDTIYYITLSITNLCGTTSYSDSVIVHPSPTSYFGVNLNSGCSPLTINFSNNSYGLPTSYLWIFGDGTTSTDSLPQPHTYYAFNNDTTYYLTLIAYNACGSDTLTDSITVFPNTVNAFFNTNPTQGCAPLPVTFTNFSTGANVFAWNFGDGNISNQFNATHVFDSAGTYTVQLIVTNGCSIDTITGQVIVWPQPELDFVISKDSICPFEVISLQNTSPSPLISIKWYWGDGDSTSATLPQHQYAAGGTYQITMIGTGAINSCIDTMSKPVVVFDQPVSAFDSTFIAGCQPLTISLTNTATGASGYLWAFGDNNFSTSVNPQHLYLDSGNYTITQIAYSGFGCTDTSQGVAVVYPKPFALFDVLPDSSCSSPVTVQFINQSTDSIGTLWTFGNGAGSSFYNPTTTYSSPGAYPVWLYVSNTFGCRDTFNSVYNVYPTPEAAFSTPDPDGCEDFPVPFTNSSLNGVYFYWDFGDGGTSTNQNPDYLYTNPGVYDVQLILVGEGGCRDTAVIQDYIRVSTSPVASFYYEKSDNPTLYGALQFYNTSTGGISYKWDFGDGTTSNVFEPLHRYDNYGDYLVTLVVTNAEACTDTFTLPVQVDYFFGLYVPNAFTPQSGPETVRKFLPKGKGLKRYRLEIFDTWGVKLWESQLLENGSPKEGWDGTFNGSVLQQDVYVWKVSAEFEDGTIWIGQKREGVYRTTGTVTLLR